MNFTARLSHAVRYYLSIVGMIEGGGPLGGGGNPGGGTVMGNPERDKNRKKKKKPSRAIQEASSAWSGSEMRLGNSRGGGMSGGAELTLGGGGRKGGGGMFGGSGPGGKKVGIFVAAVSASDVACSEITWTTKHFKPNIEEKKKSSSLKCTQDKLRFLRQMCLYNLDVIAIKIVPAPTFDPTDGGRPSANHIYGTAGLPEKSKKKKKTDTHSPSSVWFR